MFIRLLNNLELLSMVCFIKRGLKIEMKYHLLPVFFLLFLFPLCSSGAVSDTINQRYFRSISVEQGLSQSTIFAIEQDSLGFMWFGTQDGLNRFNGSNFTIYRPDKADSLSLQSNYIRALFSDIQGFLWVGGNKGISRYDQSSEKFTNYEIPKKSGEWYIAAIAQGDDSTIWAGSSSGQIFFLKPGKHAFKEFVYNRQSHNIKSVRSLLSIGGVLYIGTDAGLYSFQEARRNIDRLDLGNGEIVINEIISDKGQLWIASEGNGFFRYDTRNKSVINYLHESGNRYSLANNDVRSIRVDRLGNIWLGTFKGLSVFNIQTKKFDNYYHSPDIPYTISQNSVRYIYKDRHGGMWLGTYFGGISYFHPDDLKFNLLTLNSGAISLNDPVVNVISEDSKGNFWIGTNDKGLNYWDRKAGRISYFSHNEFKKNSLSSNNIKAIIYDERGKLLIGTHNGGLNHFDPVTGKVVVYRHTPEKVQSIAGNMVYALLKDHKGQIWVGTKSGLDLFDSEKGEFTHLYSDRSGTRLSSDEITYLMEDSKKRIWIGTNNGINIFYPGKMLFETFAEVPAPDALSGDVVTCITEDLNGKIWIGTRNGLNLYDEDQKSFRSYTTSQGFPNNVIYGILADKENVLWISTNRGLVKFDATKQSTQVFDGKDGLQSNQFNMYAFYKASDGMMLFGGINGISYFYPEAVKKNPLNLKIVFTGLEVFNEPVIPGAENGILNTHIDKARQLIFKPSQRQFTVLFNTFNYVSPDKITYQYKLSGFDKEWQVTDEIPKASYSNLKEGKYELQVRAKGPLGEESTVRTLSIKVLPPWWNTTWFYTLVFLLVVGGTYIAFRITTERLRALHELRIERIQREKNESVNKMKMEFFTNVSHEFRTPLTLILAPIEELLKIKTDNKFMRKQHQLIMLNAKRLLVLVDQLMEFRKAEFGKLKLKIRKRDLVGFVHDIYESFAPLANKNNIQYHFISSEDKLMMPFDKNSLERICFNLLSNAFKFTKSGGKVELSLSRMENKFVIIKITDSGIGIDEEEQQRIFERFYQVDPGNQRAGSGVGLALTKHLIEQHYGQLQLESTPGKGATFTVILPLEHTSYTIEEYLDEAPEAFSSPIDIMMDDNQQDEEMGEQENGHREKLLLVEDNFEILNYLHMFFRSRFDVYTAYEGQAALDLMEDINFDIIVSDVMMPGMDGIRFCKKVKQNIKTSHIPLVLLTAKNELDQQIEGFEAGADDYITKPFSMSLLEVKINSILRSRKRLKEHYSKSTEVIPEKIAFNSLDEEFLQQALQIVNDHLSEPNFSINEFSKKIGMSRSNLYLKFKAITGESATDFIKKIRFNKALELLESRQYTVAEIAYMCGFNTPSYFSTSFKQFFGYIPSEHLTREG